jgi:hypothetical protein
MLRPLIMIPLLVGVLVAADAHAQQDTGWFFTLQSGRAQYETTLSGNAPWWGRVDDGGGSLAAGLGYALTRHLSARVM